MAKKLKKPLTPAELREERLKIARQIHVNYGGGKPDDANARMGETLAELFGRTKNTVLTVMYGAQHLGADTLEVGAKELKEHNWAKQLDLSVFGNPNARTTTKSPLLARARKAHQTNGSPSKTPSLTVAAPSQPVKRGPGRPRKSTSAAPALPAASVEGHRELFFGAPREVPVIMSSWDVTSRELTVLVPQSLGGNASFNLPGSKVPQIRFSVINDGIEFVITLSDLSRPPIIRVLQTENGIKFLLSTIPGEAPVRDEWVGQTEGSAASRSEPAAPLPPVLASEPESTQHTTGERNVELPAVEGRELETAHAG